MLAPLFVPLGWRFSPVEPSWLEAHGAGVVSHIAARPEGVLGIDGSKRLARYPGDFGQPWASFADEPAGAVAASGVAAYWLDLDGAVHCRGEACARSYKESRAWGASALATDEAGALYVLSQGRAQRFERGGLVPVACSLEARAIAAREGKVYLVTPTGELFAAEGETCVRVEAPVGLTHVAAGAGGRLAASDARGVAHLRERGTWHTLPAPRYYRPDHFPRRTTVAEVALGDVAVWAMSPEGYVFLLSDPR